MKPVNDLENIQKQLDHENLEYQKLDFQLKFNHFKQISNTLDIRDRLVKELNIDDFYPRILLFLNKKYQFLPVNKDGMFDGSWIDSLKIGYENNFHIFVKINLRKNNYLKNTILVKKSNLMTGESESTKLEYGEYYSNSLIFKYFENDTEELDLFDLLYDAYINAFLYYNIFCQKKGV